MLRGRLVADADPSTVTPEELGSAMTGAGTDPPDSAPDVDLARTRGTKEDGA
jgi:simple sugar transport system ATP-binding protein